MTRLPKEFALHNQINYDIMFDKSLCEPTDVYIATDWVERRS